MLLLKGGNSFADGISGEIGDTSDVQFVHDVLPVRINGFSADVSIGSNLCSTAPFGYELENFPFPGRKNRKDSAFFAKLLIDIFADYHFDDRWAQVGTAGDNLTDGVNQLLEGPLFQHVTACTCFEHFNY